MNRIARAAALAAVLFLAAIFAFLSYLDGIVRSGIERGATHALGVETNVASAAIKLLSGSFRLQGLEVANPPGFENPYFLRLGDARLDLDMGTLRESIVRVPRFAIDGIEVDLDKQGGRANYEAILANLGRFESKEAPEPAAASEEPGTRFVIEDVVIRNVLAHVRVVGAGHVPQLDVVVPEVRIDDLGGEDEPLTTGEITDIVVKAVLASIAKAGAGLPGGVANALSSGLGRLSSVSIDLPEGGRLVDAASTGAEAAGAIAETASDAASAGAEAAGDAVEGAGSALKNVGDKLLGDD